METRNGNPLLTVVLTAGDHVEPGDQYRTGTGFFRDVPAGWVGDPIDPDFNEYRRPVSCEGPVHALDVLERALRWHHDPDLAMIAHRLVLWLNASGRLSSQEAHDRIVRLATGS